MSSVSSSSSDESFKSCDGSTEGLGSSFELIGESCVTLTPLDESQQEEILVPEAFRELPEGSVRCPEENCQTRVPKQELVDHLRFDHSLNTVDSGSVIEYELDDILEQDNVWKGALISDRGSFYYVTLLYEKSWRKFTALAVSLETNERICSPQIRDNTQVKHS